jgi:hypothetical protein
MTCLLDDRHSRDVCGRRAGINRLYPARGQYTILKGSVTHTSRRYRRPVSRTGQDRTFGRTDCLKSESGAKGTQKTDPFELSPRAREFGTGVILIAEPAINARVELDQSAEKPDQV